MHGLQVSTVRLECKGRPLGFYDTPWEVGMKSGDTINVHRLGPAL